MTSDDRILAHLDLVDRIAAKIRHWPEGSRAGWSFEELQAAGRLGLVQAGRRFREQQGASFATFASQRIYGAILDEIRLHGPWRRTASVCVQYTLTDEAQQAPSLEPSPEQRAILSLMGRRACGVARRLKPEERHVVSAYVRGDRRRVTAERLGVSEDRVMYLQRGALRKLRIGLEGGSCRRLA